MVMVAGVTRPMAGVILITDTVIPITDTDRTGPDIIVDTTMDTMAAADTIIPHLITRILKEEGATVMVTASPGQVIRNMVPGAWIPRSRTMPALPVEEAGLDQVLLQLEQPRQVPGLLQKVIAAPL